MSAGFEIPAFHDLQAILPTITGWQIHWPSIVLEKPQNLLWLFIVPLIVALTWSKRQPALGHSRLPVIRRSTQSLRTAALHINTIFSLGLCATLLVICLAQPKVLESTPGDTVTVRDLHFVIDRSDGNVSEFIGSEAHVDDKVISRQPALGTCGQLSDWGNRKIDAEVYAACKIAKAFPDDRKALATFDGATQCCSPRLNSDFRFFNQRVRVINQQLGDDGTNFEDQDGVFQVMLDYMKTQSLSSARVMFLFTDGDGTLTDENVDNYVNRLKAQHVMLICGGPGDDTVATDPASDALVALCIKAKALVVDISSEKGIQSVINAVKALPPAQIKLPSKQNEKPVHEALLLIAVIAFCLTALGWATLGRIR